MTSQLFEELFEKWKVKELANQKNRKRKYLHFDRFIQFDSNVSWFNSYFKNSLKNIPKHGFYPFIKSDIITPRIKHEQDSITKKQAIVKKNKIRPIAYASHFDSFVYSWYSLILTHLYESKLPILEIEDCVIAYLEKGKNNIDFSYEVFSYIHTLSSKNEGCVALAFDLSSFFDGIDHEILKEKWAKILDLSDKKLPKDHFAIYNSLTNYTFVRKEELEIRFPIPLGRGINMERFCTPMQFREVVVKEGLIEKNEFYNKICDSKKFGAKCGIPQGSPISACLSNIYMLDFDVLLNGETKAKDAIYRRYCDDLIVVCKIEDWEYFHELIVNTIKQYEVIVNKDKTEITFFKKDKENILRSFSKNKTQKKLQYLGFEFDGQNIYIRSSSMSRYSRRMNSAVQQTVQDAYDEDFSQQDFIFRKNLSLRFTNKGSRNFISYASTAQQKMGNSKTIKKQVKNSTQKIEKIIDKKKNKIEEYLKSKGNFKKRMR